MVGVDRIGRWVAALQFDGELTPQKAEKMIALCELIKTALTRYLMKMK